MRSGEGASTSGSGSDAAGAGPQQQQPPSPEPPAGAGPLRIAWRRVLKELSSLPRAIGLMAAIAVLSGLGTVVPQNKPLEYYMEAYPDGPNKVLNFLTYDLLLGLQLDHIYRCAAAAVRPRCGAAWLIDGWLDVVLCVLLCCVCFAAWWRWSFVSKCVGTCAKQSNLIRPLNTHPTPPPPSNTNNTDHSAWYFYALMALLGASLAACTSTTQWPAAKVAQRWRFAPDARGVQRAAGSPATVLPDARLGDLGAALAARGYQVFKSGPQLYAFKGLAGRLGPIGVHAALLLALGGTAYSGFGGWRGAALVPEGQEFLVAQAVQPTGVLASLPAGAKAALRVNGFEIETRPDGSVAQFYSDLSLRDLDTGSELLRKRISVNDPFRYGGVTMYQTDWALSAVTLRVPSSTLARVGASPLDGEPAGGPSVEAGQPVSLPLASLAGKGGTPANAKIWATFLPLEPPRDDGRPPRGISSELALRCGLDLLVSQPALRQH